MKKGGQMKHIKKTFENVPQKTLVNSYLITLFTKSGQIAIAAPKIQLTIM